MDLLNAGQKISINIIKDERIIEIICKILKVEDDRLYLELPPYFMRYVQYLDTGKTFTAKVFSKLGTIDFNSIVISSPLEENSDFIIELDYNAMKFTSGEDIPVINSVVGIDIFYKDTVIKAKTFEISTEYLKFYCDFKFSVDDSFKCRLILPKDYDKIDFKATVTEIDPDYSKEYKVTYFNMSENSRQTLLYYMYMYSNNAD